MSSSTRTLTQAKPKARKESRQSTVLKIEHDNRIKSSQLRIKYLELAFKIHKVGFQIRKMAAQDHSLSLLESQAPQAPPMSQVEDEEGAITFQCNSCKAKPFKQLKRLQNHLLSKHKIKIDLDDTVTNFSPSMVSTHEDAISLGDSDTTGGEPTKRKREDSDEEEEDNDDEDEVDKYRNERDKRAKMMDNLAKEFVNDIGDQTMEDALEEAEKSDQASPSETQAMTEKISQALKETEQEIQIREKRMEDSPEEEEKQVMGDLKKQLDLKDQLLSCKESTIEDLKDKIAKLEASIDKRDATLNKKKLLLKEKDKEIKDITKKAKLITKVAGKSPAKEELKAKCLRYERSIENLRGRLKNLDNQKDKTVEAKLEKTIQTQILEIDAIKESLVRFEATVVQLKRKIPCEQRPCPLGRKACPFNHDLEYKAASDSYKKKILCKFFADKGCTLSDDQCRYSHSLELAVKADNAGTGANQQAIGDRRHHSASSSFNNSNNSYRRVNTTDNNNMSVEVIADLRGFPENDARRTLNKKRTPKKESYRADHHQAHQAYPSSGNGQGTSGWRPHHEDPRPRPRSHRSSSSTSQQPLRSWESYHEEERRSNYERDPRDSGFRRRY